MANRKCASESEHIPVANGKCAFESEHLGLPVANMPVKVNALAYLANKEICL